MTFDRRFILKSGLAVASTSLFGTGRAFAAGPNVPAALAAAAKKEGQINVIALPRDWANWGVTMDRFQALYGVKLDSANPDGSSAEELQAIRSLKNQQRAPDVVDVGPAFAISGTKEKLYAPYKVATWNEIPDDVKHKDGFWYGDYYGVTSFAVNKSVVKNVPQTWADLKKPEYKGMIALNGNPLAAGAAIGAVYAAALANGGSFDNINPGIEFFGELAKLGNLNPAAATPASLVAGQTPIALNWDYLSLGYKKANEGKVDIDVLVPRDAPPFGNYYCMAISAYAPHPNTAKLWMEYVYSDEGQLAFLGGFAHPIRFNSLVAAGKVPDAVLKTLPPAEAYKNIKFATPDQADKAKKALTDNWPRVVKI
ncbi:ABC transporter substrate-binding protein [Limobrevibacterium gyesilva]|uniref:ABC transporter substrate-binding protein n=1 Tax=Limobrevibacterium gyesilva TaxID=2991712 RepID=A0AA41YKM3_9PROT|nr:ABC transporter substrate-binding protein [Limobrevibacterium gyesilva]MCW3474345.1 ABC transporter substrate-binding protein [Limobrevibacterium gyesilva]